MNLLTVTEAAALLRVHPPISGLPSIYALAMHPTYATMHCTPIVGGGMARKMTALYGNVALERTFCRECDCWTIVLNGLGGPRNETAFGRALTDKGFVSKSVSKARYRIGLRLLTTPMQEELQQQVQQV